MIFLGIDPGQSGGIAALGLMSGPWASKFAETERDLFAQVVACGHDSREDIWVELWPTKPRLDVFAVIERVHSMPKHGVTSSFKFGQSYGFLRGLLIASGIPFEEVTPQKWQKAMGCLSRGDKNVTKRRAQQLFPELKITHAIADALLIAEYGRRTFSRPGAVLLPALVPLSSEPGSSGRAGDHRPRSFSIHP